LHVAYTPEEVIEIFGLDRSDIDMIEELDLM
jgi:hypothetical protein